MNKLTGVTLSAIHNIVVVISPIGDQAPPAFAAMIIKPEYHNFRFLSLTIFCRRVISTIVAVKLSIIADRTNAKIPKIHKILVLLLVLTNLLIPKNPLKKSIISTMVIAPSKKINISAVKPKW